MEDNKLCLEKQPLNQEMLDKIDAYWRAANYLSAGQLYLLDNPLLREPLTMDQIKKKIVGHWGTVPGQNFVYAHCNRSWTWRKLHDRQHLSGRFLQRSLS